MSAAIGYHILLACGGIAVVTMIGLILRRVLSRYPVGRYWVTRATLGVSMAIVPAQILAPGFSAPPPQAILTTLAQAEPPCDVPAGGTIRIAASAANPPKAAVLPAARSTEPPDSVRRPDIMTALLGVCLVGAGIALAAFVCRAIRTHLLIHGAVPIDDPRILSLWRSIARGRRVQRARLVRSGTIATPACAGVFRPVVLLPNDALDRICAEQLSCALEHEALHIRRHDSLVYILAELLAACFWFHPLVHLLKKRLAEDREESCDATLVNRRGHAHTYATALLAFEELRISLRSTGRHPTYLLAGFSSCTSLERRLSMIQQASTLSGLRRWALASAVCAVALGATLPGHVALSRALGAVPLWHQDVATPDSDAATVRTVDKWEGTVRRAEITAPAGRRNGISAVWNLERMGAPAGGSITDQETILSAVGAERRDAGLETTELRLNLPEGSKLRAVIEGDLVNIEKFDDKTNINVKSGSIRIVDDAGISRIIVSSTHGVDGKGSLSATVGMNAGEVELTVRAKGFQNVVTLKPTGAPADAKPNSGASSDRMQLSPEVRPAPLRVALNLKEGVPADEKQPPHNAVRYELQSPGDAQNDPTRVKMQWIYDVEKSRAEGDGC